MKMTIHQKSISFQDKFNLSKTDIKMLNKFLKSYGLSQGEAEYRSQGNQDFLEDILLRNVVDYDKHSSNMTNKLKKLIHTNFPQLKTENYEYV